MTADSSDASAPLDAGSRAPDATANPCVTPAWSVCASTAGLVAAALVAGAGSLDAPFLLDDWRWIPENPGVRSLEALWRSPLFLARPVVALSLRLNYALGGLDVRGYHAFNLVVHAIAGLLLFGLVRRLAQRSGDRSRRPLPATCLAFAISLIWLVHPLQTQSVTYVIQRCESLMGLFFFLCLYSIARAAESRHVWTWWTIAIVACGLGMGSKEVIITAPLVALLMDRAFLATSWAALFRRRGLLHAGLFALALALLVMNLQRLTKGAPGDVSAGFAYPSVTPVAYLRSQPAIILHYLRLAVWPRPLCIDYAWRPAETALQIYPAAVAVVALVAASAAAFWRWPRIGFLGLSFFIVLAPTSSILPIADLAVEHRMYVPLAAVVSLVVLAAYAAGRACLQDPLGRRLAAWGGLTAVALTLCALTWERNRDYRDPLCLWAKALDVSPNNPRAHFSLGQAQRAQGGMDAARRSFERALELDPNMARSHGALGHILLVEGDLAGAASHLRRAIELQPDYLHALVNLGNVLTRQQRYREAIAYFHRALELEPNDAKIHFNLGAALVKSGRSQAAIAAYRRALAVDPQFTAADTQLRRLLDAQTTPRAPE